MNNAADIAATEDAMHLSPLSLWMRILGTANSTESPETVHRPVCAQNDLQARFKIIGTFTRCSIGSTFVFLISSVVAKYLTASQPHIEGAKKIIIHIFSQPYVVCVLYVSIHFIYFLNMPSLVCTCSTCTSIFSDILWMHLYDTTDDMCQIYWCLFLIGLKWWFVMEF